MPQIQKMLCHHPSEFGIIQFHCIYIQMLILVIDNYDRNFFCQLFYRIHKAMTWIAGIDNAKRFQLMHHPEIPLLHLQIPLGIAHKQSISLLLCTGFNPLKQHNIIRVREVGTKYDDQFFFPAFSACLSFRYFVSHLFCDLFHFTDRFF